MEETVIKKKLEKVGAQVEERREKEEVEENKREQEAGDNGPTQ